MSVCNHHYTDRGNACVLCFKELEERIQQLTDGINRAGAYLSQGEPNIARETLAALLPKEPT